MPVPVTFARDTAGQRSERLLGPGARAGLTPPGRCLPPALQGTRDTRDRPHYADRVPYTHLSLPLLHSGKVRELYELPEGRVLLVATDNVSAYDRVLPTPIPDKGEVLNRLSVWWLERLAELVPHHAVTDEVPLEVAGRALVVERLEMIPVECVARGYLAGSAWQEYGEHGTVAGITLPEGLPFGARLEHPIFTPARKAPQGEHDENITYEQLVELVGDDTAARLRSLTLRLYIRAERIARERGLVLVDTKFEFGRRADGTIVLADEVLTPDSSRYWDAAAYLPGTPMESFDKQYLRDWVTRDSGWDVDSGAPAPALPDDVVAGTRARYVETYRRLTGDDFVPVAASGEAADEVPPADEAVAAADDDAAAADETGAPADEAAAAADEAVPESEPQSSEPEAAETAAGTEDPSGDEPTAMVVVDVMPKPEILDPQGKAVTGALKRLGYEGLSVRQGKRFEIEVYGELTDERLDQIVKAAETLLANTVIEEYEVSVYTDEEGGCACDSSGEGCCGGRKAGAVSPCGCTCGCDGVQGCVCDDCGCGCAHAERQPEPIEIGERPEGRQ